MRTEDFNTGSTLVELRTHGHDEGTLNKYITTLAVSIIRHTRHFES